MGDSDDEYDRKRRDKFRGERGGTGGAEGGYRGGERRGEDRPRGREDWGDRNRQRDYREYRGGGAGGGRDRGYSPARGDGPPVKRMRGDWDEGRPRYGGGHDGYGAFGWSHDHYGHHPQHQGFAHGNAAHRQADANGASGDTQPAMMSFKAFLAAQDDSITDDDAIKKYNEYKLEFRRQQLNEFFVAHKDEEWFKIKYHPEESLKRREEQLTSLKNRLEVFTDLLNTGSIEAVSVDADQSDQLVRLLDTVVIKLEGGTDEDLKVLDEKPKVPTPADKPAEIKAQVSETKIPTITVDDAVEEGEMKVDDSKSDTKEKTEKIEDNDDEKSEKMEDDDSVKPEEDEEMKVTEPAEPVQIAAVVTAKAEQAKKRKREYSSGSGSSSSSSDSESETEAVKSPEPVQEQADEEKKKSDLEDGEDSSDKKEPEKEATVPETLPVDVEQEVKSDEPKALHKTTSIFLRNLSPTITKHEVEAMCKRYSGYLRVAIADPLQERRWFRRGWLTFRREVNIKEICWNLNNIRLRECELGAIVNRDLSRRIRPINGITAHKQVVRADVKLCAKITHNLDSKAGLWKDPDEKEVDNEQSFGLVSKNPVLHNITDYLIEEASAEEDELLGLTCETGTSGEASEEVSGTGETIERDPILTKVLDKLILYLRIVHSVDFYNHCEYPYEDEMPNRCGIMHARGPPPTSKATQTEIGEYIRLFESKMATFLTPVQELNTDELSKLGSKDCDGEVEKFVAANTQELAKDKWLCPLSGKKFKGPDFIRKHIFNKHAEKVEEVKKEVEYFNNYLKDPKRPQLPEHPGNSRKPDMGPSHPTPYGGYGPPAGPGYGRGGYHHAPYGGGFGFQQGYGPRPARGGFNRGRRGGSEFRPVIHYRDLDAPREPDEFI